MKKKLPPPNDLVPSPDPNDGRAMVGRCAKLLEKHWNEFEGILTGANQAAKLGAFRTLLERVLGGVPQAIDLNVSAQKDGILEHIQRARDRREALARGESVTVTTPLLPSTENEDSDA